ncbi:hypothetical protein [Streptomyces sp. cmx-4-9]|uniref:hypothetical protein n=1 Tax=Streptomyces sp. cmx-4-9 TaxID=2790941 RepID=UPI003981725A
MHSVPAQALRILYWLVLLAFNAALAWWVSMMVSGPPAFFGTDPESRADDVDAVLGLAGCLLLAAVVLWAWTVHLDGAEPAQGYRPQTDPAAWTAQEDGRRRAAAGRTVGNPGGTDGKPGGKGGKRGKGGDAGAAPPGGGGPAE